MPTIAEIRGQFPQYNDMSDADLASALHSKFYADLPKAEFEAKVGIQSTAVPKSDVPDMGALNASVNAGGNMLAFGFGDELAAGLMTPIELGIQAYNGKPLDIGAAYNTIRQDQEARNKADAEMHPIATAVGSVAGLLGDASGIAKAGLSPVSNAIARGDGLRGLIAAGAKEGAATGALYGAGTADGGTENRLAGAAQGGVTGALIGAGTPALIAGAKAVTKPVADAVTARLRPNEYASRKLAERLEASNMSIEQAANRVARNPGSTLADEAGSSARDLLRTATNLPGPARDRVTTQLTRRAMSQGTRLKNAITDNLADVEGFQAAKDKLIADASAASKPLYDQAYQSPVPYTQSLQKILETPSGKRALSKAMQLAEDEQIPFRQLFANQRADGSFDVKRVPDMRGWDYVKRAFDDMIDGQKDQITQKLSNEGRILTGLKNRMLSEVDAASPTYAQARAAFAGPKSIESAMEIGRRAVNDFTPAQVSNLVGKMSAQQREAMKLGAAEAMRKSIDKAGFTHNAILKVLSNRHQGRVLRTVFNDDAAYGQFTRTLFAEARKRATYEAVKGNSTTVRQTLDAMDAGGLQEPAQLATTAIAGGPMAATLQWVGNSLRRLGGLTPQVADEMAKRLMTQDPQAVRNVVNELMVASKKSISAAEKRARVGHTIQRLLVPPTATSLAPQSQP